MRLIDKHYTHTGTPDISNNTKSSGRTIRTRPYEMYFMYDMNGDFVGACFDISGVSYILTGIMDAEDEKHIKNQCKGNTAPTPLYGYYWSYEKRNNFFDNVNHGDQYLYSSTHKRYLDKMQKERDNGKTRMD